MKPRRPDVHDSLQRRFKNAPFADEKRAVIAAKAARKSAKKKASEEASEDVNQAAFRVVQELTKGK
jgi:hypothetical protein